VQPGAGAYAGSVARILVLGGSWFLGAAIVETALVDGVDTTTFRRGRSGVDVRGVRTVRGNRAEADDLRRLATAGPWDTVIDTSSYVPRETLEIARALEPVAGRYVLVSSVSVYCGWPAQAVTDESAVLDCPADAGPGFGYDADPGPRRYGFGKAGCERAVREVFGEDRSILLRPGVILGPREYIGRLVWWLRRMQRGGRVLVPGQRHRPIQPVDVRDVAAFAIRAADTRQAGSFNLTARPRDTMGDLLTACQQACRGQADLEWVTDEQWLVAQGIRQWTELPLWRSYRGTWGVDSRRAHDAGFATRPLRETVFDTWAWLAGGGEAIEHTRAGQLGIAPEREHTILRLWDAHRLDARGAR
jgi:2'-hydroxyisoflavone reductase